MVLRSQLRKLPMCVYPSGDYRPRKSDWSPLGLLMLMTRPCTILLFFSQSSPHLLLLSHFLWLSRSADGTTASTWLPCLPLPFPSILHTRLTNLHERWLSSYYSSVENLLVIVVDVYWVLTVRHSAKHFTCILKFSPLAYLRGTCYFISILQKRKVRLSEDEKLCEVTEFMDGKTTI